MIAGIGIRDYATIEGLDLEFGEGLSVITGETGAGKSIVASAISLALGARADSSMVRTGAKKARIFLVLDGEEQETLTREVSSEGKNVCRIDGEPVSLGKLSDVAEDIADIHGQYDQQSLLDERRHIEIIDSFGFELTDAPKENVAKLYALYQKAKRTLDELLASEGKAARELDFLRFEVREIEGAHLIPGEYEELKERLSLMQNSEKIYAALSSSYEALEGEYPALASLSTARSEISKVADFSEKYKELTGSLESAYFELSDVAERLRTELERIEYSPKELDDTIARIDLLDRLISKYAGAAEASEADGGEAAKKDALAPVLAYLEQARCKLGEHENFGEIKERYIEEAKRAEDALARQSFVLSEIRRKLAAELSGKIETQMRELGFSDARFEVSFESIAYTPEGADNAVFLLSANKGQELRPLAKTASGGEMSRIMLAIKAVTADSDNLHTLVFDEIDTGISGIAATVVGEKLRRMAEGRQIICITHLPQIAAYAQRHYIIEKSSDDEATYTTAREVTGEERVQDIARLIGGRNITASNLESARELIALSQ